MRVENIVTGPVKTTYKYGVYGAFGFCGLSLVAFIAWSAASIGGAALDIITKMV
jgi:hypothetical protein